MKRLYWTQPDTLEAEVVVTALEDGRVTTDPVLFHPDEGGQPPDSGTIGEANVIGVEVVDGQIVHRLDRPLSDGRYMARVDRPRREHTASHHTAQHIISGIAQEQFGLRTTGVHIGLERCTVDFDRKVEWDTVMTLEREVMEVVTLDVQRHELFDQADVRVRDELKPIEAGVIRVVKIGAWDQSACCGAHVRTTGRIGMVRLCDIESKKDGTRVFFLAGRKALDCSQQETNVLRELRKAASCSTGELLATFEKAQAQARDLTKEVARLWTQMLPGLAASAQVLGVQSSKVGVQVAEIPPQLVAKLAGLIAEATEGTGIAVSGTRIAISSRTLDAAALLKTIQNATGGKGGGSPGSANGNLGRAVTADEILNVLKN